MPFLLLLLLLCPLVATAEDGAIDWHVFCPWRITLPVDRYLRWEPTDSVKDVHGPRLHDRNALQLATAKEVGLAAPPAHRADAALLTARLTPIASCDAYMVDTLTYSVPYLTPAAADLLLRIATTFRQRASEEGLGQYRIIVTSVLRTVEDVYNLRASGNRNAVVNSTHCYATTFDISYERFYRVGWFDDADPRALTALLADIVCDLRAQGLCHAIFERRECCIHLTSTR